MREKRMAALLGLAFFILALGLVYAYSRGLFFPADVAAKSNDTPPVVAVDDTPNRVVDEQPTLEGQPTDEQPIDEQPIDEQPEQLGRKPLANADPEYERPSRNPLVKTGNVMALTFDDGPSSSVTPLLLDALRERNIHATFFVLGVNAERYPDIISQAFADGHQIASHGWNHTQQLNKLTDAELADELGKTAKAICDITGVQPPYVRPMGGFIDNRTADMIGVPVMLWNIDPMDWKYRDAEKVKQHILDNAFDGGVLLCHDIYESSYQGVIAAIDQLLEEGWQFVSLEEYYQLFEIEPEKGNIYRGRITADI